MKFNLFAWLREGIKQAVLLGVADAFEQIGLPFEEGDGELPAVLRQAQEGGGSGSGSGSSKSGSGSRRRLGRSLRDSDTGAKAA